MLSFQVAFSVLSSAFLSGTLSLETIRHPSADVFDIMQLYRSLLSWSDGKILPDVPAIAFPLRAKNSPAPLESEELEDLPQNQSPVAVPVDNPLAIPSNDEYSYVYEYETPVESSSADPAANLEVKDRSDWDGFPVAAEENSPAVAYSSVMDGALSVLEKSTSDLSVVFRNISVQISRLRESF
jgi:hypothetical protein